MYVSVSILCYFWIVGLKRTFLNIIICSLFKENTYEMKAPYIPMDDMIFATSSMGRRVETVETTVETQPSASQLNLYVSSTS